MCWEKKMTFWQTHFDSFWSLTLAGFRVPALHRERQPRAWGSELRERAQARRAHSKLLEFRTAFSAALCSKERHKVGLRPRLPCAALKYCVCLHTLFWSRKSLVKSSARQVVAGGQAPGRQPCLAQVCAVRFAGDGILGVGSKFTFYP